jgi:hypothetical protein
MLESLNRNQEQRTRMHRESMERQDCLLKILEKIADKM